jgi:hypothetical protein
MRRYLRFAVLVTAFVSVSPNAVMGQSGKKPPTTKPTIKPPATVPFQKPPPLQNNSPAFVPKPTQPFGGVTNPNVFKPQTMPNQTFKPGLPFTGFPNSFGGPQGGRFGGNPGFGQFTQGQQVLGALTGALIGSELNSLLGNGQNNQGQALTMLGGLLGAGIGGLGKPPFGGFGGFGGSFGPQFNPGMGPITINNITVNNFISGKAPGLGGGFSGPLVVPFSGFPKQVQPKNPGQPQGTVAGAQGGFSNGQTLFGMNGQALGSLAGGWGGGYYAGPQGAATGSQLGGLIGKGNIFNNGQAVGGLLGGVAGGYFYGPQGAVTGAQAGMILGQGQITKQGVALGTLGGGLLGPGGAAIGGTLGGGMPAIKGVLSNGQQAGSLAGGAVGGAMGGQIGATAGSQVGKILGGGMPAINGGLSQLGLPGLGLTQLDPSKSVKFNPSLPKPNFPKPSFSLPNLKF